MAGLFQINIVVGILLAYLSNYIITTLNLGLSQWRWEFGVATVPSLIFFMLLYKIPRSSRWLVTTNRIIEAHQVLEMRGSPDSQAELQEIIDFHLERGVRQEPLFNERYNLPMMLAITISINAILYYSNYIFASAGFSSDLAALQTVGVGLVNLIVTLLGMSLLDRIGCKTLLLVGSVGMTAAVLGVAAVFYMHAHQSLLFWLFMMFYRLLRNLARLGHLGLHLRGLSLASSIKRPECRFVLPLDHQRAYRGLLSAHCLQVAGCAFSLSSQS